MTAPGRRIFEHITPVILVDDTGAASGLSVSGDVEIGAVELKNASTDDRAAVQATAAANADIGVVTEPKTRRASTATLSNVNDSASSVSLLASTATRKGVMVTNDSSSILYLKYGATASTTSFTVMIAAGGYWEMPEPIFTGALDGIWSADSTGAARITELT